MSLIRSIATVGFFTVLSRIMGFARDILIASLLGAGPITDAFWVAFKFPNFFRRLFAEGAFNAAFVPTFARTFDREGKEAALECAQQVLAVLATVLLGLVIFVELTIPWLIHLIAPGFAQTPWRHELTVQFTRLTFPYIFFISLAALYTGVLNSIHRFAIGAAAPILLNIGMIMALGLCATLGPTPGHALAISVTLAGVGQWLWIKWETDRAGFQLKFQWPEWTPAVRRLMGLMGPGAMAAGVIQINMFVGVTFLSLFPTGTTSYFFFADRLIQLPLSLIGVAISTVLLPALSKNLEFKNHDKALILQNRSLEGSLLLILPATLALFLLAEPIVHVLFQRGAFDIKAAHETARILAVFSWSLPAYVMVKIFSTTFFAHHDTKTPLWGAVVAVATNIGLNIFFYYGSSLAHIGIALATTLASWINAAWLVYNLKQHQLFIMDVRLKQKLPRVLLACLGMGLVLEGCKVVASPYFAASELWRTFALICLILNGFLGYVGFAYFFKAIHYEDLKGILRTQKS